MKLLPNALAIYTLSVASTLSCLAQNTNSNGQWIYAKGSRSNEIEVSNINGERKICELNTEVTRIILSFDQKTLIFSENGYLRVEDLLACKIKQVPVNLIPEKTGLLVDFNLNTGIYIALIFVSTQPLSYVAYIGKKGTSKNLVDLPGAYRTGKKIEKMQQEAFIYSDDLTYRPKISISGKYAAPDGEANCSPQSYPGVWNIEKNRKVIFRTATSSFADCESLFNE